MFYFQGGNYEALDLADLPTIQASQKKGSVAMFDPVFGPVGRSPLEKETVLGVEVLPTVYSSESRREAPKLDLLLLGGRFCCLFHELLVEVVLSIYVGSVAIGRDESNTHACIYASTMYACLELPSSAPKHS